MTIFQLIFGFGLTAPISFVWYLAVSLYAAFTAAGIALPFMVVLVMVESWFL